MSGSNLRNISEMNVLVRSKDRDRVHGAGNPADFRLNFPEALHGTYRLVWASIPNTIYNVNSGNNKLFLRDVNGFYSTVTVEPKNYTGPTLATALTALLTGIGVTVEYDTAVMKLKFKLANVNTHFEFLTSASGSIHSVLGFDTGPALIELVQIVFKGAGPTDLGTYAPNVIALGGINSIGIRIKEGSGVNWSTSASGRSTGTALLIPFLSTAGEFQSSAQDLHKQAVRFGERTRCMSVQLVDPDTMEVVDVNGANWEMLLSKAA